jgi:hypothetical protein
MRILPKRAAKIENLTLQQAGLEKLLFRLPDYFIAFFNAWGGNPADFEKLPGILHLQAGRDSGTNPDGATICRNLPDH